MKKVCGGIWVDIFVAAKGDTLSTVAKRCGISPQRLIADNGLSPHAPLVTGQALLIRQVRATHTVRTGETVREIATKNGISVRQLYRLNPVLCGLPRLYAGQTLAVRTVDTPKQKRQLLGVVSPSPNPLPLRTALPFLTYLSPAVCRAAQNGGLPLPDTAFLFELALDYGVLPLLFLDGNAQRRFVETAVYATQNSRAAGVVVTAENTALSARLSAVDRLCFTAFPAFFHHAVIRKNGCPDNYISRTRALTLAASCGAEIQFDNTAKQPFFQYRDRSHAVCTVWLHDPRSWHAQIQGNCTDITVQDAEKALPLLVFLSSVYRIIE